MLRRGRPLVQAELAWVGLAGGYLLAQAQLAEAGQLGSTFTFSCWGENEMRRQLSQCSNFGETLASLELISFSSFRHQYRGSR